MNELHEEIEKYVNGEMTPAEEVAFEARLAADSSLAEEVNIYRQAGEMLSDEPLRDFVAMLEEEKQDYLQRKNGTSNDGRDNALPTRSLAPQKWYAIAAAIVVLVVVTITFWPTSKPDAATWYAVNFSPYPAQALRNTDNRYPEGLAEALKQYREGRYEEAATLLKTWQNDPVEGTLAMFYRSQALMASANFSQSIDLLERQLAGEPTVYTQSVQWYAALTYLANGDTQKSIDMANQILSIPNHAYTSQAKALIDNFQ